MNEIISPRAMDLFEGPWRPFAEINGYPNLHDHG
jgi:hypothetical protein